MSISITHKGLGHLVEAVNSSNHYLRLTPGDAQAFTAVNGDYIYAMLRGVLQREIVRIDVAASQLANGLLTVARGQGGTTAQAWPAGTLVLASTNADHYNSLLQLGVYRTIDYNPNEVLTPAYRGEKVYQNGPAGCERWWKAYNGTDPYWDIITGMPCSGEIYQDIGWDYSLLVSGTPVCWEKHTDDTQWSAISGWGSWDGAKWVSTSSYLYLDPPLGEWATGFRPLRMRLTRPTLIYSSWYLYNTSLGYISSGSADIGPDGYEIDLSWLSGKDMRRLRFGGKDGAEIQLSEIEFFICNEEKVISATTDGRVRNSGSNWATVRGASIGDNVDIVDTDHIVAGYLWSDSNYYVSRMFLFFDLSSVTISKLYSAKLNLSKAAYYSSGGIYYIMQEATATPPLALSDFAAFSGLPLCEPAVSPTPGGDVDLEFNEAGLTFLKGKISSGSLALCVREYNRDYGGATPIDDRRDWFYSADYGTEGARPTLHIIGL